MSPFKHFSEENLSCGNICSELISKIYVNTEEGVEFWGLSYLSDWSHHTPHSCDIDWVMRQEGFESYIELAPTWSRYKIFVNNNKVGTHVFEWSLLSDKSEKWDI